MKGQLKTLQADLAAIDRSLGLLDLSIEPRNIWFLRPVHRFKYFEAGELAKLIFDQQRKAESKPVQVQLMVEAIMDTKGLDKAHRDAVREISARVLDQLHGWQSAGEFNGLAAESELAR